MKTTGDCKKPPRSKNEITLCFSKRSLVTGRGREPIEAGLILLFLEQGSKDPFSGSCSASYWQNFETHLYCHLINAKATSPSLNWGGKAVVSSSIHCKNGLFIPDVCLTRFLYEGSALGHGSYNYKNFDSPKSQYALGSLIYSLRSVLRVLQCITKVGVEQAEGYQVPKPNSGLGRVVATRGNFIPVPSILWRPFKPIARVDSIDFSVFFVVYIWFLMTVIKH